MADKEATVYIVDVGRSMGKRHQGRDKTDLDWALQYFWDKVTSVVRNLVLCPHNCPFLTLIR
jgi:ATP-dependent DNA helicase 2 subunit 2